MTHTLLLMPDIIQLLPDSVANQIAAGEVIQRPASALKELLENAIDSGASDIRVVIKDAGRSLIQVTDNGCGMSETDARMSFERHATSKIRRVEDIFSIRTKGFRGEAMASIAAVAQVELRTRLADRELGTLVVIEGSEVLKQEPFPGAPGTTVSVKNLFYNIPARRNFLKSNAVETRHILDEFQRIAIAHPGIAFSLHHNGVETFRLPAANLRQRIVSVYGAAYNERLVPLAEETPHVKLTGFVGKPGFARKHRGEQFFFVNNRFIRDNYLHHAVMNAYEQLIPHGQYPSYFIFLDIDPARIDVNIHPTKTEIKFEDEKLMYAVMRASVKHALGQYSVSPSLDFEQENAFIVPQEIRNRPVTPPAVSVNPGYNPFASEHFKPSVFPGLKEVASAHARPQKKSTEGWEQLYEGIESPAHIPPAEQEEQTSFFFQLHQQYIVCQVKSGMMLIDQHFAHTRVLYEKYSAVLEKAQGATQQDMFPLTIEFSPADAALIRDMQQDLALLGFDIREFGPHTFVIHGIPADVKKGEEKQMIEHLLGQYKHHTSALRLGQRDSLARALASEMAVKRGMRLSEKEMRKLFDELFACQTPGYAPGGGAVMVILSIEELQEKFK